MRRPCATVRFSLPLAAVEQLAQSVRVVAAAPVVVRITSKADLGPCSAGKRSFHVSIERPVAGGRSSDGSAESVPAGAMRSVPVNRPIGVVPVAGARRACTSIQSTGIVAAAALPQQIAAANSPTATALFPAIGVLITSLLTSSVVILDRARRAGARVYIALASRPNETASAAQGGATV